MIVQGMSGIMSITGEPDGGPVRVGTSISDLSAGLFTVVGVLAALHARERTGRGQMVDVAMLDSVVALLENAVVRCAMTGQAPRPLGARHPAITPFELFRCKDSYVILALSNDVQWQKFIEATGAHELAAPEFATNALRTQNHDKLKPLMDAIMARKTSAEWMAQMEAIGIACGPLNTVADLFENPQLKARDMLVSVEHATAGVFKLAASPVRLSAAQPSPPRPAPDLGQHTEEVLVGVLGYTPAQVEELRREGAV
jgi:CoA:oxalate CoA-transferase